MEEKRQQDLKFVRSYGFLKNVEQGSIEVGPENGVYRNES